LTTEKAGFVSKQREGKSFLSSPKTFRLTLERSQHSNHWVPGGGGGIAMVQSGRGVKLIIDHNLMLRLRNNRAIPPEETLFIFNATAKEGNLKFLFLRSTSYHVGSNGESVFSVR
jgi:hypothetical protein